MQVEDKAPVHGLNSVTQGTDGRAWGQGVTNAVVDGQKHIVLAEGVSGKLMWLDVWEQMGTPCLCTCDLGIAE